MKILIIPLILESLIQVCPTYELVSIVKRFLNWTILIIVLIGCYSCTGQVQKNNPKESESKQNVIHQNHPKLIKTQNSQISDNVNCSLEDKSGNLWFGTTGEGIYVYDGKTFTHYTKSDGLKSNMIFCVFESSEGEIWLGTYDGLYIFSKGEFNEIYITSPISSTRKKFSVFSILEENNGKLWIATVEGVYVYDGNTFELFTVSETGKGYMSEKHNTENMLQDKNSNIWFGSRTNDGVFRYDGTSIVNFKLEELDDHKWGWPTLEDEQGNIWFNNWGGTYRYDGKSFESFTKSNGLCSESIMRIIEDSKGNIWFGGGEGICRYDGKSFEHFTIKDGLPHNGVWSILEDSKQNIWIGTRNTGLCKFDGKTITSFSENRIMDFNNE